MFYGPKAYCVRRVLGFNGEYKRERSMANDMETEGVRGMATPNATLLV